MTSSSTGNTAGRSQSNFGDRRTRHKLRFILQLRVVASRFETFLGAADAYAQVDPKAAKAPTTALGTGAPGRKARPVNPPREQVLEVVAQALKRSGRPMQLRELFDSVTESGIILQGTDPSAVLGTMIWRARTRFANLKGFGYWFKDRPYAPASYEPES
jgi:hypothetical protein